MLNDLHHVHKADGLRCFCGRRLQQGFNVASSRLSSDWTKNLGDVQSYIAQSLASNFLPLHICVLLCRRSF